MASPKKQKGWTLIELTVVMVILAFLYATDKMSNIGAVATKNSAIQRTENLKYMHGTYLNNHVLSSPSAPFPGMGVLGGHPIAADFSGYCVADGWKIRTYKDANGTTPTTAATDPVCFIAAAPEEDATNCPKGPADPSAAASSAPSAATSSPPAAPDNLTPYVEYEWPDLTMSGAGSWWVNFIPYVPYGTYECTDSVMNARLVPQIAGSNPNTLTILSLKTNNQTRFALATDPTPFCRAYIDVYSPGAIGGITSNPAAPDRFLLAQSAQWSTTVDASGVNQMEGQRSILSGIVYNNNAKYSQPIAEVYAAHPQRGTLTCAPYQTMYGKTYTLTGAGTTNSNLSTPSTGGSKIFTSWNKPSPSSPGTCVVSP